jgi:hypothetical protein
MSSSWKDELLDALQGALPPGTFACFGRLDDQPLPFLCPEIAVEGVGRLGLPLAAEQAGALSAAAEQAPYGRGTDTLVDTAVRDALQVKRAVHAAGGRLLGAAVLRRAGLRCTRRTPLPDPPHAGAAAAAQVDAARIAIGASWQPVLRRAVHQVAEQLGLPEGSASSIDARLYKLLLYEEGGHFAAHQDTEKEPGMFGTLVVQLPCAGGHQGGRLLVRHRNETIEHDFAQAGPRARPASCPCTVTCCLLACWPRRQLPTDSVQPPPGSCMHMAAG